MCRDGLGICHTADPACIGLVRRVMRRLPTDTSRAEIMSLHGYAGTLAGAMDKRGPATILRTKASAEAFLHVYLIGMVRRDIRTGHPLVLVLALASTHGGKLEYTVLRILLLGQNDPFLLFCHFFVS